MRRTSHYRATVSMHFTFTSTLWYWKGPAPFYFVTVPAAQSRDLHAIVGLVTYGWGMIPVAVQIGNSEWTTSLFPKDGGYVVPIKARIRQAEQLREGAAEAARGQLYCPRAVSPFARRPRLTHEPLGHMDERIRNFVGLEYDEVHCLPALRKNGQVDASTIEDWVRAVPAVQRCDPRTADHGRRHWSNRSGASCQRRTIKYDSIHRRI